MMQTPPLILALQNSFAQHVQDCCSQPNPDEAFSTLECQMSKWRQNFTEIFELLRKAEGGLTNEVSVNKLGLMMRDCWRSEENSEPSDEFCELLATIPPQLVGKLDKSNTLHIEEGVGRKCTALTSNSELVLIYEFVTLDI